ncbi:methyl-accepting chemotaxis protein [Vibrio metschnikovii]|uniref:methyl-accepting chemotaxis protein n=1 Tax=Vibrio metschnikovii TaxID=28172 RepID=UPI001C30AC14|nr:methyl-accepting chemotaxis protein [Vibrio metschnikovii]
MKFTSIRQQVLTFSVLALLSITLAVVGFSYHSSQILSASVNQQVDQELRRQALQNMQLIATQEALGVKSRFDQAMLISQSLSSSLEGERPSREVVTEMLRSVFLQHPDLLGIYTGWEAHQFDGDDIFSLGLAHSKDNGQFAPYWNRSASGQLGMRPLGNMYDKTVSSTGVRNSEWYLCPIETGRNCVIDPASYDIQGLQTLLSSFVSPVMVNGKAAGMVGVDYSLNFLQRIAADTQKHIDRQARVLILSPKNIVSADSSEAANVGKALQQTGVAQLISKRVVGQSRIEDNSVIASAQFRAHGVNDNWEVIVILPVSVALAQAAVISQQLDQGFSANLQGQLWVGGLLILLGIIAMWVMALSISRPIQKLVGLVEKLTQSGGDLTQTIKIDRRDETGQLAHHLNTFVGNVRSIVSDVAQQMDGLTESTQRSASYAKQGVDQIRHQRAEIEQVVTATNEMSSTAHSVSDNAQETASAVTQAQQEINQSQREVEQSAEGLKCLANDLLKSAQEIEELEAQSEQVGSILDVIRAISEQTNLLALNAAIEAARAGDQGRGFAVVADEVRNLATRTAQSTDEIQTMIDTLRQRSKKAVATVNESRDQSNNCQALSQRAVDALKEVRAQSERIQDMAHQIATAAEEQAAVTEEVNRNIVAINDAANEIDHGASAANQESRDAANRVSAVSSRLNQFKY